MLTQMIKWQEWTIERTEQLDQVSDLFDTHALEQENAILDQQIAARTQDLKAQLDIS